MTWLRYGAVRVKDLSITIVELSDSDYYVSDMVVMERVLSSQVEI